MHTLPPSIESFVSHRYAYDELLVVLGLLKEQPDNRPAKVMFLEAARDYLDAESKLPEQAASDGEPVERGMRRATRANLLTCLMLFSRVGSVSMFLIDRLIGHIAEFLATDPIALAS